MESTPASKVKLLCLHGSQQDGNVFASRLKQLRHKLSRVAELHFIDAPHTLPLQHGQTVAMRAWWRHPGNAGKDGCLEAGGMEEGSSAASRIVRDDFHTSIEAIKAAWKAQPGGYDGLLGFSNGGAAALLVALHAAADPDAFPGLRLLILAGAYVPEPLHLLAPLQHLASANGSGAGGGSGSLTGGSRPAGVRIPSLHLIGSNDEAISIEQSMAAAALFDAATRKGLVHDMRHCVPQRAEHCRAIAEFLSSFLPPPPQQLAPRGQPERPIRQAPPAAAPPAAEARSTASVAAAQPAQEATEEQLEELGALEAIFGAEYALVSTRPPACTIELREPGTSAAQGTGLPCSLFSIVFTMPPGYPATAAPGMQVVGPLSRSDARSVALMQRLQEVAEEALRAGAGGSVYQIVEAAKEWIAGHVAPDVGAAGSNRSRASTGSAAGQPPAAADASTAGASIPRHGSTASTGCAASGQATGIGGAALPHHAGDGKPPLPTWHLEEAIDIDAVKAALQEVAAFHSSWGASPDPGDATPLATGEGAAAGEGKASAGGDQTTALGAGRWDFVVGLVGKPSAGKSTFFNAIVDPATEEQAARVAAFPFTTITPNVSRGLVAVPDPCLRLVLLPSECGPLHGFAHAFDARAANPQHSNIEALSRWASACSSPQGGSGDVAGAGEPAAAAAAPRQLWRRVPIIIKDVAGLVPGAYQGRGRGNAFLNDLCDADVLIHVVDISASADKEGQAVEEGAGADPLGDVEWVREELACWVFSNLRAKWAGVLRRPVRLLQLFSGYHAPRALVQQVVARVGLTPQSLAVEGVSLAHWTEADAHRLVAHFLQVRFPMLLALNKADLGSALTHLARLRAAKPHEAAVAVSAASERWLCQQRRAGRLEYADGAGTIVLAPGCDERTAREAARMQASVLDRYGTTGVLAALSSAVALKCPAVVFPVADLESFAALPAKACGASGGMLGSGTEAKARAAQGANTSIMRDCLLMRPGSTVLDVMQVLKRPPFQLLDGEFVRAECSTAVAPAAADGGLGGGAAAGGGKQWRVMRKEEQLDFSNSVVKIMTNKRAAWQSKGGPRWRTAAASDKPRAAPCPVECTAQPTGCASAPSGSKGGQSPEEVHAFGWQHHLVWRTDGLISFAAGDGSWRTMPLIETSGCNSSS